MEIETVKKKRGYTKIDPSNYELVALAACTRDRALAKQLGLSRNHFSQFVGYAANYVTKPDNWEKRYTGVNTKVTAHIRQLIDSGECSAEYRKGPLLINKHGKHSKYEIKSVKEENPAEASIENPIKNINCIKPQVKQSRTDVDRETLIKEALATLREIFKEVCQTIRSI